MLWDFCLAASGFNDWKTKEQKASNNNVAMSPQVSFDSFKPHTVYARKGNP